MSGDDDPEADSEVWERGKARLNRTVAALMERGLSDADATRLHREGHTLSSLKQSNDGALAALGLIPAQIAEIRGGGRPPIPVETRAKVLWANRSTCCVCRQHGLAIILHHITPWAETHDHSAENLAVLCLEHHARAHTRGDLEQNLTPERLRHFKAAWEQEVQHLDARAILAASRINGHQWWWFNHLRLFELAAVLNIRLPGVAGFAGARTRGMIDDDGALQDPGPETPYRYQGGNGTALYAYVREVLAAVLERTAVFNISEDLDRGFLSRVVSPGDIVFVQGRHVFKQLNAQMYGPGQAAFVRRQANRVRVSFTVDRWDATATSPWASWMQGAKAAASLVRVISVDHEAGHLHLACTGLAMGFTLQNLSSRSYHYPTWMSGEDEEEEFDDGDWLNFGDDQDEPTESGEPGAGAPARGPRGTRSF
jgi:hypothetical protein